MAEIVNLRMARKARDRAARQEQAAQNRARFGESRTGRLARERNAERTERTLDGARRDPE